MTRIKNLLIIGFVWPEPKSSAAGSRMMQLIEAFQDQEYQITFASPCAESEQAFDLTSIGVTEKAITLNDSSFDGFIKDLNPDIVLFDRFMMEEQFGWRVAEECPSTLRILDTEDLHCLRKGRQQAFKDEKEFDAKYLYNDFAKREIASIYRCDVSLMISEVEMDILTQQFKVPESLLMYVPFMLEAILNESIQKLPRFEQREHFITIGNFLHEPNYNAILYLKEMIWPLIRQQLPNAELHVYGAYASQKVLQLHNRDAGFLIKGFAEDVNEVMQQSRVCLAPLRFGAGLKGKLIDAMKNGTPCVMTTIAAEGIYGVIDPNGCIEDDPEAFATRAIDIYQNESFWNEKQLNGFQVINKRFNKSIFKSRLFEKIENLQSNLQAHRQSNFTGQMFQYHAMQSTKYMSKWIEEKNMKKV